MSKVGLKSIGLGLALSLAAGQLAHAGGCLWGHGEDATAEAEISTPEVVAEVTSSEAEPITLVASLPCGGLEGAAYVQCVAASSSE